MSDKKIVVSKKELKEFLNKLSSVKNEKNVQEMLESWIGADAMPAKSSKPVLDDEEAAIVSPLANKQVSDTDLPVGDDKWMPGNVRELGMAMKQLAEYIPEGQISFFWPRVKTLIDKANDNLDQTRSVYAMPRQADTSK